jgi:hypothetical protein
LDLGLYADTSLLGGKLGYKHLLSEDFSMYANVFGGYSFESKQEELQAEAGLRWKF